MIVSPDRGGWDTSLAASSTRSGFQRWSKRPRACRLGGRGPGCHLWPGRRQAVIAPPGNGCRYCRVGRLFHAAVMKAMPWLLGSFMGCWLLLPLVILEVLWSVRLMASLFLKPGINHCPPPPCLDGPCSWGCWKLQDAGQLGVLGRESWEGERCPSRLPLPTPALPSSGPHYAAVKLFGWS